MPILKKSPKAEAQLNVKISAQTHARYLAVKEACRQKSWEFTLQPEFETWLNVQLAAAEKELAAADKTEAKSATQADASA
ncbi:MAG: hypothetical protein RDU24_12890 [Humidesulfovibrio sp.]|uniref:hypothetical protein n=1 Tax=Humidesulfovibrio sp. TaxID=2910988 RepID=UPI0027F45040|nr:hypothetical protein [Humidesulfovibrio sp.]MDQ7836271.1 hypothetical protein [Humidesulfovibrio sp.]